MHEPEKSVHHRNNNAMYFKIRSNYQNNLIQSSQVLSPAAKMDRADAALIRARYAVLRARYSRVSTQ